ncbi:MAG: DivIVA domain-containing protein [Coriobacteriales bacterium]|jgi:cell division initiation protein|nr:DivIVA domain-containing protein [Coriobacteriales bacterium]
MGLTAMDIQQQSFNTSRHGYDAQEVDVFLERIALEVDNFNRALVEAKNRIDAAEARAKSAEAQAALAAKSAPTPPKSSATEEQISKAFIAAQRSADALKEEARIEAEKAYREAEQRARDIVRDAMAEKQRILDEIDRLRESCEKFRTDYLSILNHFSTDAQKVMPTIDGIVPDVSSARATLMPMEAREVITGNDASLPPSAAGHSRAQVSGAGSLFAQSGASAAATSASSAKAAATGVIDSVQGGDTDTDSDVILDFEDDIDIEEID